MWVQAPWCYSLSLTLGELLCSFLQLPGSTIPLSTIDQHLRTLLAKKTNLAGTISEIVQEKFNSLCLSPRMTLKTHRRPRPPKVIRLSNRGQVDKKSWMFLIFQLAHHPFSSISRKNQQVQFQSQLQYFLFVCLSLCSLLRAYSFEMIEVLVCGRD